MFSDSFGVQGIVLCKCSDNILIGLTFYATEKKKKNSKSTTMASIMTFWGEPTNAVILFSVTCVTNLTILWW